MKLLSKPELSIILITYNQSAYIEQAINGLLSQDYDFSKIQIIVADDCSTDDTFDKVKTIFNTSNIKNIKYLERDKNLGITLNYRRSISACDGEYIAILEGDDYWTSISKLSKQIRLLKRRKEFIACGSNYYIFSTQECKFSLRINSVNGYTAINCHQLVDDNLPGNFSTMVYRSEALKALPSGIFSLRAFDWIFHILMTQHSQLCVLHEPMSVYRVHSNGQWSGLTNINKQIQMADDVESYIPFCEPHVQKLLYKKLGVLRKNIKLLRLPFIFRVFSASYMRLIVIMSIPPIVRKVVHLITPPIVWFGIAKIKQTFFNKRG